MSLSKDVTPCSDHSGQSTAIVVTHRRRLFSPVVLFFHDRHSDTEGGLIEAKKVQINEMLRMNSRYWSHIIQSTRPKPNTSCISQSPSPPQTPPQYRRHLQPPSQPSCINKTPYSTKENDEGVATTEPITPTSDWYPLDEPITNENGRKRRGNLPKNIIAILKQWLTDHCNHPYPTEEEKVELRTRTNLTLNQISNWFINARRRHLPLILVNVDDQRPSSSKRRRTNGGVVKSRERAGIRENSKKKTDG
ncbi:hypothetical protein CLU79DRAFT_764123 [Phycomyces nitens]|nr:hypothetical protein CLU79DRAFT_764123 [Phycomyces nitens]